MYDFNETLNALERGTLSKGLRELHRFCERTGLKELALWVEKELDGYDLDDDLPSYRIGGYTISDLGKQVKAPDKVFREGVLELEYSLESQDPEDYSSGWRDDVVELLGKIRYKAIVKLQSAYTPDAPYIAPDFAKLIADPILSEVLKSRWEEANRAYQANAPMAVIFLLGSILEGCLFAKVDANQEAANRTASAPKDEKGKTKVHRIWTLDELIKVAHECGWIKKDRDDFAKILRDYRNYIHPREHAKSIKDKTRAFDLDESTCKICFAIVEAAISDLSKH